MSAIKPVPRYARRLERVREQMKREKLDAYVVFNRSEQYWLTGFTGEDGHAIVTQREVTLMTDGRFDETAQIEAPWARKVIRKKRTPEKTVREFKRLKLKRIGFDPDHLAVRTWAALSKESKPTKLVSVSGLIRDMRLVKDEEEIAAIRRSIRIAESAFRKIEGWAQPGMSEREVAARLIFEMGTLGAEEPAFHPIVASGATGSLPHYTPQDRKLSDKEGVLVDWGARCGWYVSDLTRMLWPGSIPKDIGKVYEVVREAHDAAIAAVKPGAKAAKVDRAARLVIEKAGFGQRFQHALGHGIGLDVHEAPRLGMKSEDVLTPGMVVTIEPGVYLPGVGGVRIESDVLVTDAGAEVLSSLPY